MLTQNLILDFSHIYPEGIEADSKEVCRMNMSDIEGTNLYCSKEAEEEIRKRLKEKGPHGIHFIDNGNYHYMTKFFVEKIRRPFSLILFDYHSDMQEPMMKELTSCGSWVREIMEKNHYLEQIILIGPDQKSIDEIEPSLKEKLICISIQELEKQQGMEKAKEIKAGDIVESNNGNGERIAVIDVWPSADGLHFEGISSNKTLTIDASAKCYTKTGRHIDIGSFLKQIGR